MIIKTERLQLRPLTTADLATTHKYSSDLENTRYMFWLPRYDINETREFLQGAEDEWRKAEPSFFEFAVTLEGVQIGAVSLHTEDYGTEIGWIIDRDYWGKGYASEAAAALMDFAKSRGISELIAHCDGENAASRRMMEKLGFTLIDDTGTRRNRAADHDSQELTFRRGL